MLLCDKPFSLNGQLGSTRWKLKFEQLLPLYCRLSEISFCLYFKPF